MNNNHYIGVVKKQAGTKKFPFTPAQTNSLKHSSNFNEVESACIAPNKVVVATAKRAWLYQSDSTKNDDRFAQPMDSAVSIADTQKLLDRAIAAAKYAISSKFTPPALTPTRWVWRLAGAYHLCHPAEQLMKEATKRFVATKRWNLAEWAMEKAEEERGHDRLALLDIQSLGYDAEAVVKELVPPAAVTLTNYFTQSAQSCDPIDCVGYAYTMERLALGIGEEYVQKIEELLPPNTNTTRCLRVHSHVGADAEHVEETVAMLTRLNSQERVRVARACYETALLWFSSYSEGYISDKKLQQKLKSLKLSKSI